MWLGREHEVACTPPLVRIDDSLVFLGVVVFDPTGHMSRDDVQCAVYTVRCTPYTFTPKQSKYHAATE